MLYNDFMKLSFEEKNKITDIEFEEGTKIIDNNALAQYKKIKNIYIPATVESIGTNVFAFTSIEKLIIPDSVKQIGWHMCTSCPNLKFVKISDNIEKIGSFNFIGCDKLEKIFCKNRVFKEEAFLDAFIDNGGLEYSTEMTLDDILDLGVSLRDANKIFNSVNIER